MTRTSSFNLHILPWDLSALFLHRELLHAQSLSCNFTHTSKWNIHSPASGEEGWAFSLQRCLGGTKCSFQTCASCLGLALPLVQHRNKFLSHWASRCTYGFVSKLRACTTEDGSYLPRVLRVYISRSLLSSLCLWHLLLPSYDFGDWQRYKWGWEEDKCREVGFFFPVLKGHQTGKMPGQLLCIPDSSVLDVHQELSWRLPWVTQTETGSAMLVTGRA